MDASVKERLLSYIEAKGISIREFEKSARLSNGYLKSLRHAPSGGKLSTILSTFPDLNRNWLLTGEGEMLLDASSSRSHEIKYYPDVWGSLGDRLLGNADERTAEIWHMPAYSDCQYAINAYGDSMSPLIKNGDVVLLSEWNENYIEWGLVYLVITRAGHRTIKRLYANGDDGVICRSENSEKNPDFLIQKSDILKLYIVKGRLSRDTL